MIEGLALAQIGAGTLVTIFVLAIYSGRLVPRASADARVEVAQLSVQTLQSALDREVEARQRLEGLLHEALDGPVKVTAAMVMELRAASGTAQPAPARPAP